MKLKLLDFQEDKAAELVRKTVAAQSILRTDASQAQAVILSSPTGSGKTVIMAAALEAIVNGDDERLPNPKATILWLSDSPELNEQSRQKFAACSDIFTSGRLETIEPSFDHPILEPGKIYFINTQKFSSTSTLTRPPADGRKHTIWQTITNTIEERGANFFLIIDEAHKGMLGTGSQRDVTEAQTIVQRFLLGSEGQIPKVPLVLGLSATPRRFNEMLDSSNRTGHKVLIEPAVVRASGLLKHRLLIHNPEGRQKHADDSLLREAVKRHAAIKQAWQAYCVKAKENLVRPLLVIQVEDGDTTQNLFSRTNIDQVIRSIRETLPGISADNICHCFQDEAQVKADGMGIRKVEPSKLQDDIFAEIVLFKTALTTGWDCPRAETMMSYRTARDLTMIEQLIGRMVRAPLARSVEANDALNTVRLFLPGFDRAAVQGIIKKLSDPNNEDGVSTEVEDAATYTDYSRRKSAARAFEAYPQLPTFRVPKTSQQAALVRVLKLATRLSVSTKVQENAKEKVTDEIVKILIGEADTRRGNPGFEATVSHASEIRVEGHLFDVLANRYRVEGRDVIEASDENVDQLFRAASRRLSAEEALGVAYWRARHDDSDPNRAKLEFFALVQEQEVRTRLDVWAQEKFDTLYSKNRDSIMDLPPGKRREIERLAGGQEKPVPGLFIFKDNIELRCGEVGEKEHIYCNDAGDFYPFKQLNGWERAALEAEEKRPGFIGWFRNPEVGDERVAVPYRDGKGTWRTKAPDFVVFHESSGKVHCALIEPHDIGDSNSWCIAQGLANFAAEHESKFSRIELVIEQDGNLKCIDLIKPSWRKKVLAANTNDSLQAVFAQIG